MKYQYLIDAGLVKEKVYGNGLRVLKYTNKVFYKNLFAEYPDLEECRGLVLDADGTTIMRPFRKVYNYLENGAGSALNKYTMVQLVEKVNGFMAQVTTFDNEILVGTTGTLDSSYAALAEGIIVEQHFEQRKIVGGATMHFRPNPHFTYLFEICDPSDPHIVDEKPGAYLIGIRDNDTGALVEEAHLDQAAHFWGFYRPKHETMIFEAALRKRKECRHEGFMVLGLDGKVVCKMKSQHYLAKKALMRMGKARSSLMYNNTEDFKKQIDEEYYKLVDFIIEKLTLEEYQVLNVEMRRALFENYFKDNEAF